MKAEPREVLKPNGAHDYYAEPTIVEARTIIGPDGTRYRRTPEGQMTVAEIVHLGDRMHVYREEGAEMVKRWGIGYGIVVYVVHYTVCTQPDHFWYSDCIHGDDARGPFCYAMDTWTVGYVPETSFVELVAKHPTTYKDIIQRHDDWPHINSCVAQDGRILQLFEANTDEIVIDQAKAYDLTIASQISMF